MGCVQTFFNSFEKLYSCRLQACKQARGALDAREKIMSEYLNSRLPRTNPASGKEGTKTRCLGIATSSTLTAWPRSNKMVRILFPINGFPAPTQHQLKLCSIFSYWLLPHAHREKSLPHVSMVAKSVDLNKPWSCKYGQKTIKMTWMTFLCIIAHRKETVAHTFLPSFDNANGRLGQERLLRSRNFATILHLVRNEKGTGLKICPPIVSGIVTEHAPVSYWWIVFPVPSNSPNSLCKS